MPRNNTDQTWGPGGASGGAPLSQATVVIPDSVIEAEEADGMLRTRLANLRTWAGDTQTDAQYQLMTNPQLRSRLALLDDRVAKLARGMAYLIRKLGVED